MRRLDFEHPGRSAAAVTSVAVTVAVAVALGWLARREIKRLEGALRNGNETSAAESVDR